MGIQITRVQSDGLPELGLGQSPFVIELERDIPERRMSLRGFGIELQRSSRQFARVGITSRMGR